MLLLYCFYSTDHSVVPTVKVVQSSKRFRPTSFASPPDQHLSLPSFLLDRYRGLFSNDKAARACSSLLSSAKVKTEWRNTSTAVMCLHDVNRDKFTGLC